MRPLRSNISSRLIPFFLLVCLGYLSQGQENNMYKDSLLAELRNIEKKSAATIDKRNYADLLLEITPQYYRFKQDSLYYYSQKALSVSKSITYGKGIIFSLSDLAIFYSYKGDSENALAYINKAIKVADSASLTQNLPYLYNLLALEHAEEWNQDKALYNYLKALDYAEQFGNTLKMSEINENIAQLYVDQEQYKTAYTFYEKVLKINASINDPNANAETFLNLAFIEIKLGLFEDALNHVNQSISFFEKHGPLFGLAYALHTKAEYYINQEKYHWALQFLEQCGAIYHKIGDQKQQSLFLYSKASALYGLKKIKEAKAIAIKGLKQCETFGNTYTERDLLTILHKICKEQGQIEEALAYHERCAGVSNAIHKDKNNISLAFHKSKMLFEKEKDLLIAKNEEALRQQGYVMYASIAILLVLLAMAIPLFLNHKKLRSLLKEIKISSKALKEREVQLKATNNTKDRLFSIIGHDLRGPIGALQHLLGLIGDGEIEKNNFDDFLPKIKIDVDHILFTLNNLLSWGNSQNKSGRSLPQMVLLKKIAQQNIQLLSEMAARKSITITNKIPSDALVLVDENQIDVVLRNLISNAIKFTPNHGSIVLKSEEFEDYWRTAVQDTGVGMDEKTMRLIFSENATVTNYGTNKEKGTGLGLSLCQEMVKVNQGEIWVESKPQKGSTFYFTIPKVTQNFLRTA